MRAQKIRTKFTRIRPSLKGIGASINDIKLTGWLDKDRPFLRIEDQHGYYLAVLEGAQLYRLAKAICRRFEA